MSHDILYRDIIIITFAWIHRILQLVNIHKSLIYGVTFVFMSMIKSHSLAGSLSLSLSLTHTHSLTHSLTYSLSLDMLHNLEIQWYLNASTVRSCRQLHITHVTHHPCHTDTLMEVCHWVSAVRQTQVKSQSCLGAPPGKTFPQGGKRLQLQPLSL